MTTEFFLQTNFSAGELSPRIEGRPDLAKFYNGCLTLENFMVLPQGGVARRPGTRYAGSVKTASSKVRLIPFVRSVSTAFILEFGDKYIRFWKNLAQVTSGGSPYEIASPYSVDDLFTIQFRQSADVMYLVHRDYPVQKLSHLGDADWTIGPVSFRPPATVEADTDISGGTATLTPSATTGTGVTFTASSGVFLAADAGRQIIYGAARAIITTYSDTSHVDADILDDFPDTDPIAAGDWLLRNSPQTSLNPNKQGPEGTQIHLISSDAAFRSADVGKYIKIYGGVVRITTVSTPSSIYGQIEGYLSQAPTSNPVAAVAGTWTLEVAAWSSAYGYPGTIEFHEGRVFYGGTYLQPTTIWASKSDDYENMATGALADDALQYTLAFRVLNTIEWLASLQLLLIGDDENESAMAGAGIDEPIGGDVLPRVKSQGIRGSAHLQPIILNDSVIFTQRMLRRIFAMQPPDITAVPTPAVDMTLLAEHITAPGLLLHPPAIAKDPNSQLFFLRCDGQLLCCTFIPEQQVLAWSRYYMDNGIFESVAVIPHPDGDRDQIWVSVQRQINGATARYIEYFDDKAAELVSA